MGNFQAFGGKKTRPLIGPFPAHDLSPGIICTWSNTTRSTSGAGTANTFGAHEFTSGFEWGSCSPRLGSCCSIFCFLCSVLQVVVFLCLLAVVLSVHFRFKDSDYPFGIFKEGFICELKRALYGIKCVLFLTNMVEHNVKEKKIDAL